jgi:hypothetical protein
MTKSKYTKAAEKFLETINKENIMSDFNQNVWNNALERVKDSIEFDPAWNNGTGYMNGLVENKVEVAMRFFDTDTKRAGLIFPLCEGKATAVIFERYGRDEGNFVLMAQIKFHEKVDRYTKQLIESLFARNVESNDGIVGFLQNL